MPFRLLHSEFLVHMILKKKNLNSILFLRIKPIFYGYFSAATMNFQSFLSPSIYVILKFESFKSFLTELIV